MGNLVEYRTSVNVGGKVVQDGEAKYPKSASARMVAVGSGEENVPFYLMVGMERLLQT
jgi:hypothetical protein